MEYVFSNPRPMATTDGRQINQMLAHNKDKKKNQQHFTKRPSSLSNAHFSLSFSVAESSSLLTLSRMDLLEKNQNQCQNSPS